MKFSDLRLSEPILRAVSAEGYTVATPIQTQAIPHVLEGKDVMGCAQTGTGKTAAFALPILQRLNQAQNRTRCLVLCPTRELALQIADSFRTYGRNLNLKHTVIFGGVNQHHQVQALRRGVDILIATPGRLLDLMNQGHVDLRSVEVLVLDEADRMLDMGFIHDIRRIIGKLPAKRQTLMFSATMPQEIRQLANTLLRQPVTVQVTPAATPIEAIDQSVYFVDKKNKPVLLAHLYNELPIARAIVFTRTKHGADRVVRHLHARGIRAEAIHGNKSQNARERALANFRACKTPILVATDIASRGIDVDGITHVVNYDLTHEPETYVHRIGRTARAGASGAAVSFCDRDERQNLKAIESLIRRTIPVRNDHPVYPAGDAPASNGHRHDRRPQAPTHAHHPRSAHQTHQTHQTHQPSRAGGGGARRTHAPQATLAGLSGARSDAPARPSKPQARHPLHGGPKHRVGCGVSRAGGSGRRPF